MEEIQQAELARRQVEVAFARQQVRAASPLPAASFVPAASPLPAASLVPAASLPWAASFVPAASLPSAALPLPAAYPVISKHEDRK